MERFGIQIVPTNLAKVVGKAKEKIRKNRSEIISLVDGFKAKADCTKMKEDTLQKMATLKLAIWEWVSTNNCQAIAIECWSALPQLFGILPCF